MFKHNVCIEVGMHGIGPHKNGLLAAMWLKCRPCYSLVSTRGSHRCDFGAQIRVPADRMTSE